MFTIHYNYYNIINFKNNRVYTMETCLIKCLHPLIRNKLKLYAPYNMVAGEEVLK